MNKATDKKIRDLLGPAIFDTHLFIGRPFRTRIFYDGVMTF